MKLFKYIIVFIFLVGVSHNVNAQDSKFLYQLVDSLPNGKPVFVNFEVPKGFMATERIAITNNGKSLFYGIRNGYDSISKAHIVKIDYENKKWSEPKIVFTDSSGAPSFSKNEKTMYFQYDHSISPKGISSVKAKDGWSIPKVFLDSLNKSHYLQSPNKNRYYYSAGTKDDDKIQDIFRVLVSKKATVIMNLGFNIKGDWIDFYVSPDESYIVLLINQKNNGESYEFHSKTDLFISFVRENGSWSKPVNLGKEVNGSVSPWNWGPYVTDDKKYLFFSSWSKKVGTYMIDFEPLYNRAKSKLD